MFTVFFKRHILFKLIDNRCPLQSYSNSFRAARNGCAERQPFLVFSILTAQRTDRNRSTPVPNLSFAILSSPHLAPTRGRRRCIHDLVSRTSPSAAAAASTAAVPLHPAPRRRSSLPVLLRDPLALPHCAGADQAGGGGCSAARGQPDT